MTVLISLSVYCTTYCTPILWLYSFLCLSITLHTVFSYVSVVAKFCFICLLWLLALATLSLSQLTLFILPFPSLSLWYHSILLSPLPPHMSVSLSHCPLVVPTQQYVFYKQTVKHLGVPSQIHSIPLMFTISLTDVYHLPHTVEMLSIL